MGDHERSATVATGPQVPFDHLADVENLPRYFASMRSAEPVGVGAVHTVADVDGTHREGEACPVAPGPS